MSNLIFGRQPVLEALKSDASIEKIFVLHRSHSPIVGTIYSEARRRGIPVVEASEDRFRELTKEANTQGVIAVVGSKEYVEAEEMLETANKKGERPFLLVLDEIEDPQNLGALIRSAECAGVHGIIIPKHHAASINETVVKASAGATAHILIARVTNIAQTLDDLKRQGLWIIGSDMEGDQPYYETDYLGPIALVVGNEGKGIRRLVKEKCDFLVKIPMHGKMESLNASVSGALLMFEAARKRHAGEKSP